MQHKLKAIVAAATLALAGAAHADLTAMNTTAQNGSLAFVALDSVGNPISILVDLNYNLNDFLPTAAVNAPGTTISWNFLNNTLTVGGVQQAGDFQWSSAWSTFLGTAQSADLKWAVIAGDSQTGQRYLTTGNAPATALSNSTTSGQTLASSATMAGANNLFTGNALLGTHATSLAGASTATSGGAYAGTAGSFNVAGTWATGLKWSAWSSDNVDSKFYFINVAPRTGATTLAQVTTYGSPNVDAPGVATDLFSTFSFNSATGTLNWVTPVPEPTSTALFLAGLAAVGFVGRRRRNA